MAENDWEVIEHAVMICRGAVGADSPCDCIGHLALAALARLKADAERLEKAVEALETDRDWTHAKLAAERETVKQKEAQIQAMYVAEKFLYEKVKRLEGLIEKLTCGERTT